MNTQIFWTKIYSNKLYSVNYEIQGVKNKFRALNYELDSESDQSFIKMRKYKNKVENRKNAFKHMDNVMQPGKYK